MDSQQVTVAEAARLVGRDRKSLYRDIKAGRLSATQSDSGARQVAVSELLRVYGHLQSIQSGRDSRQVVAMPRDETATATARIAVLEAELQQLRERLIDKDKNIEDLRNTIRLLGYKVASNDVKKGWFSRVFIRK